jgi:hypothetical protein
MSIERDYRDLALEDQAGQLAGLRARVAEVEAERNTYQELLSVALDQLRALTVRLERAGPTVATMERTAK